jgi:membrane-associated tyrosine/threonine-specific cdc2-inhibitory kinase
MTSHFDVLSTLGRGTFADVYRVRSKVDGRLYAIKRNRRQFRGKRDREKALLEVKCMQSLQSDCADAPYSLYLLFFFQAWQEEGHFFSQTELCCRDTCKELMEAIRIHWSRSQSSYPSLRRLEVESPLASHVDGRLVPESTIWKICHDVSAGLSHIHSRGFAHFDLKPANIFLVPHSRLGAMCKIGDFGMAGVIGSSEDGQEGDQKYMAPELLVSGKKNASADIFSLGLTLYELASSLSFCLPSEGVRWHEIRSVRHTLNVPCNRSLELQSLIQAALVPTREQRPTALAIGAIARVAAAGDTSDDFLRDYIHDIESNDRKEEQLSVTNQTPRQVKSVRICSPHLFPDVPIYSPEAV